MKSTRGYNLFFALFPDQEAAEKIEDLALSLHSLHKLNGKPFTADRFHISLQNLGHYERIPNEVLDAAGCAAAQVSAAPFNVTFDRAVSFSGGVKKRPLVLLGGENNTELQGFYAQLGTALKQEGLGRFAVFSFEPHLTLCYAEQRIDEHPVGPLGWCASKFVLICSHVGETRYDFLGSWPLRSAL